MKTTTYRLKSEILAVYCDGEHRGNVYIPARSVILVEAEASPNPLIPVVWEGKRLKLFLTDLEHRAEALPISATTHAVTA